MSTDTLPSVPPPFVHLHCHTHYSLLDGAARIGDLVNRTKELGMPALAITDHGNLYGSIEFYKTATEAGIKPIIGYEAYVAPGHRTHRSKANGVYAYHLTLLAKNMTGYQNLIKMASAAYLEGFYNKPRIDKELLEEHHDGLVCLSGCASAEFSHLILKDQMAKATELAEWYAGLFGEDFYVEVQDNGLEMQRVCKEGAVDIAQKLGLPLVATCDTHYLKREDAEAHEILLCINTGKVMSDKNRMKMDSDEFYLKGPEEMYQRFGDLSESLKNSVAIADKCNLEMDFSARHFPTFECPPGKTAEQYLRDLCDEGMDRLYGDPPPQVAIDRLEHELGIINRMGFASYFLIVWEFVNYSRENGIRAGARGSGCGAIVSYLLGFSFVDPIEYDLLFERFLDPNRAEAPDIDIDFCQERRDEVIQYVREKYGADNVAQIGTFGTMAARAVVRDVGRALDIPLPMVDKVAKLLPAPPPSVPLRDAIDQSNELRDLYKSDQLIKRLLDVGMQLEGLARHSGTHAAGVVIADQPLWNYIPLQRINRKDVAGEVALHTTQWDMANIEKVGMLKMDFLGLRNLTVIDKALARIKESRDEDLDLEGLPLDDPATFELIQKGDTKGVFQLEAAVVRDILVRMRPDNFRDIIAVNALNRPATLKAGMDTVYIDIKHGRKEAEYKHEMLKDILEETHGVMVYQEQVMRILNRLGGIELSSAYACIKAISKKKPEIIERNKEQFLQGAQDRGLTKAEADEIFDLIVMFGGYGFNKSHSTAYALIAYQTAYLKAHYPAEFMAALLSTELGVTEKLVEHIEDSRASGLEVYPPDINKSSIEFSVEADGIRFGLGAIKGVGASALKGLVKTRETGEFQNLFEMYERVDPRQVTTATVHALIKAGACDSFGVFRSQLELAVAGAAQEGLSKSVDKTRGQLGLFDDFEEPDQDAWKLSLQSCSEWEQADKLAKEKEVLGFYMSGHPLKEHQETIVTYSSHRISDLGAYPDQTEVILGGMMSAVKYAATKRPSRAGNSRMVRFQVEDLTHSISAVMFPDALAAQSELVSDDLICFIQGRVDRSREQVNLMVDKIVPLEQAAEHFTKAMVVRLQEQRHSPELLNHLNAVFRQHPGPTSVLLDVSTDSGKRISLRTGDGLKVKASERLVKEVAAVIGPNSIRFSAGGGR